MKLVPHGEPYAGKLHVRFDEGAGVPHGASRSTLHPFCFRGVSFSVMVDNLLDETYCDYASYGQNYWPAQGRTFTFAVRYQF